MPFLEDLYFRFMTDSIDKSNLATVKDNPYEAVHVYGTYPMLMARLRLLGIGVIGVVIILTLFFVLESWFSTNGISVNASVFEFSRWFLTSLIAVSFYVLDSIELKRRINAIVGWLEKQDMDEGSINLIEERARIDSAGFAVKALLPLLFLPIILSFIVDFFTEITLQTYLVPIAGISLALGFGLLTVLNRTYMADLIQHSVAEYKWKQKQKDKADIPIPLARSKLVLQDRMEVHLQGEDILATEFE